MRICFFGDLLLGTSLNYIVPTLDRTTQQYRGVDRTYSLSTVNSPSWALELTVNCFVAPETDYSKKGFRAREATMTLALINRSETAYPVCWIESSAAVKTVTSVASPTITCTAHGYVNGQVLLVRRLGVGLYTLGTVAGATTDTFTLTSISGSHAVAAGDQIHLVQQYYPGMIFKSVSSIRPTADGDYFAESVDYQFFGSGQGIYTATSITLA